MFWEKNEKLETLKDMVGSRAAYHETIRLLELNDQEKDIFLRASVEVKKSKPNLEVIDRAHDVLVGKSFQGESHDEENNEALDENIARDKPSASKSDKNTNRHDPKENVASDTPYEKNIMAINQKKKKRKIPNETNEHNPNIADVRKKSIKLIVVIVIAFLGVSYFQMSINTVSDKHIVKRNGLVYKINSEDPFIGKVIGHYNNGQESMVATFKNGLKSGKCVWWHKNGQKEKEGYYINNKPHGNVKKWYSDGSEKY